jgi:hypothetical protein
MTNKENLQHLLQLNVQLFGENARSTLDLKRQLDEMEQKKSSGQSPQILAFQAGLRAVGPQDQWRAEGCGISLGLRNSSCDGREGGQAARRRQQAF